MLRTGSAGRAVATALCALGVLALLGAWLALRRAPARTQVLAAAAWSAPLLVAPPLFSRDVWAYAGQGALVAAGLDPYARGPDAVPGPLADAVAPQYAAAPSPYGPLFLGLAARVVALTGQHPAAAVLLLRLLAVAGLLLVARALPRLSDDPARALWLGLANPLVLLHGVAGAHNEALMAGLLLTGLAARSPAGRAAAVTLGGLVKAPALAGLAALALADRHRPRALATLAALAVTASAVALVTTAAAGLDLGWVRTSTSGVPGPDLLSPVYGLGRALQAAGVPGGLDGTRTAAAAVGLLAAGGLLLTTPRQGPARAVGLALLALAALAPSVQPWYLLWGLLPLAAVAGPAAARALAAGSVVLCLAVLPSGVPLLQGPTWGVPLLVAGAAAAAAVAAGRTGRSRAVEVEG